MEQVKHTRPRYVHLELGMNDGVCVCTHVSVDRAGESERGSVRMDVLEHGNKPGLLAEQTH